MKKIKLKVSKKLLIPLIIVAVILLFIIIFGIIHTGNNSPKQVVKDYLNQYKKGKKSVTSAVEYNFADKLDTEQEQRYQSIIKKQYRNLKYTINEEYVTDTEATLKVTFSVKDLKSSYDQASSYIAAHEDEFLDKEKNLDNQKVINYKLDEIEETREIIDYTITITCYKDEFNKWHMNKLKSNDIAKLQGVF